MTACASGPGSRCLEEMWGDIPGRYFAGVWGPFGVTFALLRRRFANPGWSSSDHSGALSRLAQLALDKPPSLGLLLQGCPSDPPKRGDGPDCRRCGPCHLPSDWRLRASVPHWAILSDDWLCHNRLYCGRSHHGGRQPPERLTCRLGAPRHGGSSVASRRDPGPS
jgi:hypothetical protein